MPRNLKLSFLLIITLGFIYCPSTIACNCGCKNNNCGPIPKNTENKIKEQKLFCEAPKDWLLAIKELGKINENSNPVHVCDKDCNLGGNNK